MKVMKTFSRTTQILTILASLAALVLFFLPFATFKANDQLITLTGSQMSFKGDVMFGEASFEMARSADVLLCLILSALATLFAALTFKFKGMRYAAPAVSLFSGIYMLVIALSRPASYVDCRPFWGMDGVKVTELSYTPWVWGITAALLAAAVIGIAYLLISDKIAVAESKNSKGTIPKRIVRFFKDYKSEVKKIVWPNFKFVVKNTVVVLVICLIVGAFIWLLDFGLAELVKLLYK